MRFISMLFRFWVILFFVAVSGYFAIYNQDPLTLELPPAVQVITIPEYVGFMAAFILGATVVIFFFGIEHVKKSLEIRKLSKKVKELDGQTFQQSQPSTIAPESNTTQPSELEASSQLT